MRILLLLIALSTAALGQIQVIPGATSSSRTRTIITNLQDITINVNPNQYIGTNVSMTSYTNGVGVTSWKWRILHRYFHSSGRVDTLLHRTSSVQNPTFLLDSTGFYDVQLTARNSVDKYFVYETRLFVAMQPRFTEGQADLVVDLSTGPKFYDFRGLGDKPDYKIYLKGQNSNAYLEFVDLHGTLGHPVRIQKSNDNVQVQFSYSGGSAHPWYFSQYSYDGNGDAIPGQAAGQGARYIVVDGFNLNGTQGIKVTGPSGSTITIRVEGKMTDIAFYGIEVQANPLTINGAAIALVPTVSPVCNKTNWAFNNGHIWRCTGIAGEEFAYLNESNQSTGYIGNHGFNPPSGYGHIISRNTIYGAGRDPFQLGSGGGEVEDNYAENFGQQHDAGGQESCIVINSGGFGAVRRNYCITGEMMFNIASGEYAYSPATSDGRGAGHTTPQPLIFEGNIFKSGSYGAGGTDETHAIYIQNNPNSGAGNWTLTFSNNTIDTDNKCAEMLLALGGYASNNFTFANNIVISSGGNAGDTPEFNVTGNGKASLQSGTKTINNIFYSTYNSSLYFKNYSTGDFNIISLLSTAYSGSPTTLTAGSDYYRYPLSVPITGYFFGAQGNYNKRIIAP